MVGSSSRRRIIIVVVEGFNDYLFLKGLIRGSGLNSVRVVKAEPDKPSNAQNIARQCRSDCIVVLPLKGIGNIKDKAIRMLIHLVRTIPGADTLVVLVDGDTREPAERVERMKKKLDTLIKEMYKEGRNADSYSESTFAYACFEPERRGAPRLCIASWRCSAECWIALASPGCDLTSLAECPINKCKACMEDKVKEEIPRDIENAVKNPEPWHQALVKLSKKIKRLFGF